MDTNDPHLSKTPLATDDSMLTPNDAAHSDSVRKTDAGLIDDSVAAEDSRLAAETSVNKGTETFDDKDVLDTEHVKAGDMPARQPDRRDQEGNAFDEGINDKTTANASPHNPKSDEITDLNRYASVDNAQTRVLNTTDQLED